VVGSPEREDNQEAYYVAEHLGPQGEQLPWKFFSHSVGWYLGYIDTQHQQRYGDGEDRIAKEDKTI
jgi:hypothetical protein